jgi:hypothetical protein
VLRRWTLDAQYERQLVTADDGGTIGLDHYRGVHTAKSLLVDAPVLLVLHGVTGTNCARIWHCRQARCPIPSPLRGMHGCPVGRTMPSVLNQVIVHYTSRCHHLLQWLAKPQSCA